MKFEKDSRLYKTIERVLNELNFAEISKINIHNMSIGRFAEEISVRKF